jgi:hypothetical protein
MTQPADIDRMDLSGMGRAALETYAANLDAALELCEAEGARLRAELDAYRAALGDLAQLARDAANAASAAAAVAQVFFLDDEVGG